MSTPVGDEHMSPYVYCSQHLAVHTTGWCTVPASMKLSLKGKTRSEATADAYARRLFLFGVDYAMPKSWWCSDCGTETFYSGPGTPHILGHGPWVPCFAPLPTPEETTWEEDDDDTVVSCVDCNVDGGSFSIRMVLGGDLGDGIGFGAERWVLHDPCGLRTFASDPSDVDETEPVDIDTAIRHIAEE